MGPMRTIINELIGDSPVRIVTKPRRQMVREGAANIVVGDGVVMFVFARCVGGGADEDGAPSFLLAHDICHLLAARDGELSKPNLGLVLGNQARAAQHNEERTLAYQVALLGPQFKPQMDRAIKILGHAARVRAGRVAQLAARLTPEKIRAEWDRKMQIVAKTRAPALV